MSEVEDPTPATTEGGEQDAPMTAAAARKAELALPPDIAADSISGYLRTSVARIKGGESGVLPVVGGLLLISILFQSLNSNFLTAGNLVNLLVQAAVFSLLAMAEVFVLLLGEIDLSVGFVAGVSAAIMATRMGPSHNWSWPLAVGRCAARLRRHRPAAGHDHHPYRPALVRCDAGRPPVLAGRAAEDPRIRRQRADQQPGDQRHRQPRPHPDRRLDPDAGAGRALRRRWCGCASRSAARRAWWLRRRA